MRYGNLELACWLWRLDSVCISIVTSRIRIRRLGGTSRAWRRRPRRSASSRASTADRRPRGRRWTSSCPPQWGRRRYGHRRSKRESNTNRWPASGIWDPSLEFRAPPRSMSVCAIHWELCVQGCREPDARRYVEISGPTLRGNRLATNSLVKPPLRSPFGRLSATSAFNGPFWMGCVSPPCVSRQALRAPGCRWPLPTAPAPRT